MANLKFNNPNTGQWEEIKINARLTTFENTVYLNADSGIVPIGVSQFNPVDDVLMVRQNTVPITKGVDYTIAGDGLTIYNINNPSQIWKAGTRFDFLVLKNVNRPLPTADGSLLQDGSVTDAKLATGIQIMPALTDLNNRSYGSLKDRLQNFDKLIDGMGINVVMYGASGSNITTLGSMNANSNILTVSDIKDFKIGQGIVVKGVIAGASEVASLTITAGCITAGNVTVTLDGVPTNIALNTSDNTPNFVAAKIRNAAFNGWTTGGSNNIVTFTANIHGVRKDATYNSSNTGAIGAFTTVTQGVDDTDLYSVISSISGKSIVLRDNATYQVANTVISHDDTEAFQRAIDDAISKVRREIYVPKPPVQYNLRTLNNTNNVMFISDGGNGFTIGNYKIYSISKNVDSIGDISTLTTANKTSTVAGINENKASIDTHKADTVSHVLQSDKDSWNAKPTMNQLNVVDTKVGDVSTLGTTAKNNTVNAINEVNNNLTGHMNSPVIHITQTERDAWNAKPTSTALQNVSDRVGDTAYLQTANNTSTVSAINEVNTNFTAHASDSVKHVTQADKDNWNGKATVGQVNNVDGKVGDPLQLNTTNKTNTVSAINENKLNIDNHKNDTVSHVTQSDKDNWNAKATVSALNTAVGAVDTKVGDITTLTTTAKASTVAAINELKINKLEGLLTNSNIATNAGIVASKLAIQKMYRKSTVANPSPTANTYSTYVDLVPVSNFVSLTPLGIQIDFGGSFASETVTVQITTTFSDATTASVTKTATATGTVLLTVTDMITLAKDGLYINKFSVQSKSTIASTTATVTVSHYGFYL